MRRSIVGITVLALIVTGAYTVMAGDQCGNSSASTTSAASTSCSSHSPASAASCESSGKIAGHFDPAISGMCRFSCATKAKYQAKSVMSQPGAKAGKLTRCPVSGVVFAVDASRPHVRVAGADYVTCCDMCAKKLKKDPRHYLKA